MKFSNLKKLFLTLFISFICGTCIFALSVPELTGPVVDNANLLTSNDFQNLTIELNSISEQTGTQIAVLTVPSLEGEALESYSMRVCEEWKLGSKKNDDGVLLLIAFNEKKIRIETGYGLEGQLTDTKCGLIIRQIIAPAFQRGNYSEGIVEAVRIIESFVLGENPVELNSTPAGTENSAASTIIVIIFMLFYFFVFTGSLSRKFKFLRWLPWFSLFQGSSSGHYSSHSSSHSSSHFGGGGFGGGGFSGGGGSFGGGGASGGW